MTRRWNKFRQSAPGASPWSRRAFLGGSAAVIGLPFLRSLLPVNAKAADDPVVRLIWLFAANGMHMAEFTPDNDGPGYDLKRILAPLVDIQDQVSVITGLSNRAGEGDRAGDHARGAATFLTCTEISYEGVANGVSCDQLAAQALGDQTLLPSLELGAEGGSGFGQCDSGYSCAYSQNVAWAGVSTPQPKLDNPRTAFERLFVGFNASLSDAERQKRAVYQTSVLDLVVSDVDRLNPRLGVADRAKLDEYLTGVRELEQRIAAGEANTCDPEAAPASYVALEDLPRAMADVMVTAMQCDLTRFATFMFGNGGSNLNYRFLNVSGAHHEISHHQDDPDNFERLTLIDTWEVEQLAYLLDRLQNVEEGDGTLLDNTLVMMGSEISDGNRHNHYDMPVLLAGGGGGAHLPGRHIRLASERPVADLYTSMLQAAGVAIDTFGMDGTGPLTEIAG